MRSTISLALAAFFYFSACTPAMVTPQPDETLQPSPVPTEKPTEEIPMSNSEFAHVLSVKVSGNPGSYQFAVEISSPDTGCERYTDWWEVVGKDEGLIYRRILLHSHVTEQPFTRNGGPVDIPLDEIIYVRAHMNVSGYGGQVMMGSVVDGFKPVDVEAGFGSGLERIPPLPENCAF